MRLLPRRLPASWRRSLEDAAGARAQVLAWAESSRGVIVALPGSLWIGTDRGWRRIGWHEIESGGWNVDDHQLVWKLYSGARGSANLADPARLPEVFRERVQASVVLNRHLPIDGTRNGAMLAARRNLEDGAAPLVWVATPGRGTSLSDPENAAQIELALQRMRAEYDN